MLTAAFVVCIWYQDEYLKPLLLVNFIAFLYVSAYVEALDNVKKITILMSKIIIWITNLLLMSVFSISLFLSGKNEEVTVLLYDSGSFKVSYETAEALQLIFLFWLLFLIVSYTKTKYNTLLSVLRKRE